MPRYIQGSKTNPGRFEDLVKALAKELKASGGGLQPLILEQVTRPNGDRDVTVIWDRWRSVPEDARPEVIIAAYERAEGKEYADSVMTAEGVTASEAAALGILRYAVVPARRRDDPVPAEAYRKAVAEEAKHTLLGGRATELRYARLEDAEEAYRRLTDRLPGSAWAIAEQVPAPGD